MKSPTYLHPHPFPQPAPQPTAPVWRTATGTLLTVLPGGKPTPPTSPASGSGKAKGGQAA